MTLGENNISFRQFCEKIGYVIPLATIQGWRDDGKIGRPNAGRGKYEQWYLITQVIKALKVRIAEDKDEAASLKDRLGEARAVKIELQNAEAMGELVRASEVANTWANAFVACRSRLLAASTQLVDELEGITDPVIRKEILDAAIYDALEELGNGGIVGSVVDSADDTEGD